MKKIMEFPQIYRQSEHEVHVVQTLNNNRGVPGIGMQWFSRRNADHIRLKQGEIHSIFHEYTYIRGYLCNCDSLCYFVSNCDHLHMDKEETTFLIVCTVTTYRTFYSFYKLIVHKRVSSTWIVIILQLD